MLPFAERSYPDQADCVREALKALLGETPTIDDYWALIGATEGVIAELKLLIFHPLPQRWLPDPISTP